MHLTDFLCEAFPYPLGSEMPSSIIDYRDPKKSHGRRFKYDKPIIGKHMQDIKTHGYFKVPTTHLTLTKDGKVIVWYWGHANTVDWGQLLDIVNQQVDPIQGDADDIVLHGSGYLIGRSRKTGNWMGGDRNRYSKDLVAIVRALLERGVATPGTPIWIGNSAGNRGEHIGTVRHILANDLPSRLVMYHGTDTFRLAMIQKAGLKPMDFAERVWNQGSMDKDRPAHREDSVYLTASRPQAEYYARKAVTIDRHRHGPQKRRELYHAIRNAESVIQRFTAQLERYAKMSDAEIASEDAWAKKYKDRELTVREKQSYYPTAIARAQAVIEKGKALGAHDFNGEIQPVILQITLTAKEFAKLMADDDHLSSKPGANPDDWQGSLSHFGQIAFRGVIPPNRIKVIATGAKEAGRVSD